MKVKEYVFLQTLLQKFTFIFSDFQLESHFGKYLKNLCKSRSHKHQMPEMKIH